MIVAVSDLTVGEVAALPPPAFRDVLLSIARGAT